MARTSSRAAGAQTRRRAPKVRYSLRLVEGICERIAAGEAWRKISREAGMPSHYALYRWRDQYPEVATALRAAREMQADCWAEEAREVANGATGETLAKDKVRVSTLLTLSARAERLLARDRAEKAQASAKAEPGKGRVVLVAIRDFMPVELPDGRTITRELLPDGSYVDHD